MNLPVLFNKVRSFNNYILLGGMLFLVAGLLAVGILNATNWWNITLVVLGLLVLAVFLTANLAEIKAVGKKRTTVVRANLMLVAVAMFGIAVGVNYVVSRHPVRFDLTSNKIYSLSDQTLEILKKLPQDVDVTMITTPRTNSAEILKAQQLLEEYSKHSSKFHFRVVDGTKNPSEPQRLNITSANTVVFQSGANRKDVLQRDYVTYAMQGRQPMPKFQGEAAFTQALMSMTDTTRLTFYFTKGHGEKDLNNPQPDGFNEFKSLLEKQNYTVKDLDLITTGKIPDDATVLASLGPQKSFQPAEEKEISDFLKRGGKLILCVDPQVRTGLESLLKDYGISLGNDMAIDPTRCLPTDPRAVVPQYSYHPIVEKLSSNNMYMVMPFSQSVQKVEPNIKGVSQTIFLQTTDKGWGQKDLKAKSWKYKAGIDNKGPLPLAMACELALPDNPTKKTRVVVFGGSNFLSNQALQIGPGNGDVGLNSFSWAAEEENKISIHPKEDERRLLNLDSVSANVLSYLTVYIIPLGTLLIGGVLWWRRRSL